MEITAALAADLALLTQALDEPGVDIVETLHVLASDARSAVHSYLGLTVTERGTGSAFTVTAMDDLTSPEDVLSSLLMPLPQSRRDGRDRRPVVILYAARPGAFVDLAADLSWLTGLDVGDFVLDEHLTVHAGPETEHSLHAASVIDQAIGVLLGHGYPPEQARLELDARAADAGQTRLEAAIEMLRRLRPGDPDPADAGWTGTGTEPDVPAGRPGEPIVYDPASRALPAIRPEPLPHRELDS